MSVFGFDILEIAYVWCPGVCCSEHLSTLSVYLFMHSYALQKMGVGIFGGKLPPSDVPRINTAVTSRRN